MTVREKKTRSSTPRTRTGCATCRKRRIKCDEGKPVCVKCTRSGWTCDGYESNVTGKSVKSQTTGRAQSSTALNLHITTYSLPFRIPGSQTDRQALHYFCIQGSQAIAGHLDSEFWSRVALQTCHQDSIVRQSLTSLSSVHLACSVGDEDGSMMRHALAQHGKALRSLRRFVESPSPGAIKTALICCILFYCFETTLGNTRNAMKHLQNGLSILSYHRVFVHDRRDEHISAVAAVFERLDLQATMFDDGRRPQLSMMMERDVPVENTLDESTFASHEDSRRSLIRLQNWLFHFLTQNLALKTYSMDELPSAVLLDKQRLEVYFAQWKQRLDRSTSHQPPDAQEACGRNILLIQWKVCQMLLNSNFPPDRSIFGAIPNRLAEDVIDMARAVMRATEERNTAAQMVKTPRRNISSETGIVAPLFILAMKCADQSICTAATKLLASSNRREGLYDSQTMAKIVRQFRAAEVRRSAGSEMTVSAGDTSLEDLFAHEIDNCAGGMDRKADLVNALVHVE